LTLWQHCSSKEALHLFAQPNGGDNWWVPLGNFRENYSNSLASIWLIYGIGGTVMGEWHLVFPQSGTHVCWCNLIRESSYDSRE
jgi:hypothetical protein